jgi:aspartyl-tRNA(Asn)/glutamyl-tRNA(Gln) amidotransferase subunit B
MGDVLSNLNERHLLVRDATMNVEHLAALIALVESEAISRPAGKEVLTDMLGTGRHPQEIVDAKGLGQVSDTGALEAIVTQVIAAQEKSVADYRGGKTTALQFLVGQCMRASKGKANPNLVADVLRQRLDT